VGVSTWEKDPEAKFIPGSPSATSASAKVLAVFLDVVFTEFTKLGGGQGLGHLFHAPIVAVFSPPQGQKEESFAVFLGLKDSPFQQFGPLPPRIAFARYVGSQQGR